MQGKTKFSLGGILVLLLFISGCSSINKAAVNTGKTLWQAKPAAMRQAYPAFIRQPYMTIEMITTDIQNWEIHLLTKAKLGEVAQQAEAEIRFTRRGGLFGESTTERQRFALTLKDYAFILDEGGYYRYIYRFHHDATPWYQAHLQQFHAKKVRFIDFHYLQPLFPANTLPRSQVLRIEYKIAQDYEPMDIGQLMRNLYLGKRQWLDFCQDPEYLYDKRRACGSVEIADN
ncbi:hypothetical protein ACO1PK_04140 [Alishewanella sp. d11]|uniref:hypothetical protein n=1 Tax=Alishewanella sp. d11 TaxID=3414030 RepID=UPI003BF89108